MDNMAYLQQIAVDNNKPKSQKPGNNFLLKFLNIKTAIIALAVIVVLIIIGAITSSMHKVDNKDQDLLVQSWYDANSIIETTYDSYYDYLKSSDIRSLAASIKSALIGIRADDQSILLDKYGIEVDDLDDGDIAKAEVEKNSTLNSALEQARLDGVLDRTFAREMALQLAYLRSYQSGCGARVTDQDILDKTNAAVSNLDNLYTQLNAFAGLD